jgi:hypothetical protein
VNARRIASILLVATMATSAWYFFAYLVWWEWNRAIIAGVLFVAAEVGFVTLLVFSRVDRVSRQIADANREARVRARLDAAPNASRHFAWLRQPQQLNVFVPVLLGAGLIASGIAWLVERIARLTGRSNTSASLSADLADLAPQPGGFLGGGDPIDLLQRPRRR